MSVYYDNFSSTTVTQGGAIPTAYGTPGTSQPRMVGLFFSLELCAVAITPAPGIHLLYTIYISANITKQRKTWSSFSLVFMQCLTGQMLGILAIVVMKVTRENIMHV